MKTHGGVSSDFKRGRPIQVSSICSYDLLIKVYFKCTGILKSTCYVLGVQAVSVYEFVKQ